MTHNRYLTRRSSSIRADSDRPASHRWRLPVALILPCLITMPACVGAARFERLTSRLAQLEERSQSELQQCRKRGTSCKAELQRVAAGLKRISAELSRTSTRHKKALKQARARATAQQRALAKAQKDLTAQRRRLREAKRRLKLAARVAKMSRRARRRLACTDDDGCVLKCTKTRSCCGGECKCTGVITKRQNEKLYRINRAYHRRHCRGVRCPRSGCPDRRHRRAVCVLRTCVMGYNVKRYTLQQLFE